MLFSSLTFIFLFLPLCLVLYFIIPKKYLKIKNFILLIFSLLFYAWGEPKYVFLMLITVFVSYIFGLLIDKYERENKLKKKKLVFIISIIIILLSLLYFKYTNFFIDNLSIVFKSDIKIKKIVLPIGISFYTFQILSYIIDLYRKNIKVQRNFLNLALYISFFPQLIAGPIVRYKDIEEQLNNRTESLKKVLYGTERFILGLGKKVIIANNMAVIADAVFNSGTLGEYTSAVLVLGIVSYTFQIYFDFSGYSDMAIGLGKIFGFDFLENFNYPYLATSINDFWKRWHISLTTFFREYIYFPLGGNRVKKARWILNLFIIWSLTGFWHGADWTFVLWGVYYFILIIIEKLIINDKLERVPRIISRVYTLVLVCIGWTLFRSNTLFDFLTIIKNCFVKFNGLGLKTFVSSNPSVIVSIPYILFAIIFSTNIYKLFNDKCERSVILYSLKKVFLLIVFLMCIVFLVSSMYNPFIYFRF